MQILCSPGSFNILMRPGALEINNSFLFPSLLYSLPSLTGMEQDQRYWHNREMGGFILSLWASVSTRCMESFKRIGFFF